MREWSARNVQPCELLAAPVTPYGGLMEQQAVQPTGIHCFVELYDCPTGPLNDESFVRSVLRTAVKRGWATLLHEVSHKFHPHGVTAIALIAESHVAIHTWPEYGYVAVDAFTCGDRASAERACLFLVEAFHARRHSLTKLVRGAQASGEDAPSNPPPKTRKTGNPQGSPAT